MKGKESIRRAVALCLWLVLVLTLLPAAALAVDTYTTSDQGVAFIEEFEGYSSTPYADNGKWYIGYGTECDPSNYPNGISEAEAHRLMRDALVVAEDAVNKLLMDYSIPVTQYQFDAMVSMTYNLGTQWIIPQYRFCGYLISGIGQYTEVEVVNAIGTWCHQGTLVREQLVKRRLREAYLFLYGQYENDGPDNYRYINYNANGGTVPNQTVFYPIGRPYGELAEPTSKGRTFLGWYLDDGTMVSEEDIVLVNQNVTARWVGDGSAISGSADFSDWVNPYKDVASSDWHYSYVRELSAKGIMSGYENGTLFQPNKTLSVGEAMKMILVAVGYQDPGNSSEGHWAANYLFLAEELGCVFPGEITDLDGEINRLTVARIAAVAMGQEPRMGDSPFADVDDGYTLALYEERILEGTIYGGKRYYYPDSSLTRAEACAIVSRISNWTYTEVNDPGKSGYIKYGNRYVPVLKDVPAAPYNKNLFVKDGSRMYYNDPAYTTAWGIDVSSHQKEIDWQKVADAGVEFVFMRLGYRGYGMAGTLNMDPYFEQNLAGAKAAGLKVGVYFFSQAISTEEALEEAQFVLDALNGETLEYPLVYDWETISGDTARTDGLSNAVLTDCAIAFCERVAEEGYTPMVYFNLPVGYLHFELDRLTDYDSWFAQYPSSSVMYPSMYYNFRIWQYTDSGSLPGIEGKVDMDIAFIPY